MTFWQKLRWWLTPLGLHDPERPEYPKNGPQALSERSSALSDEQEPTK